MGSSISMKGNKMQMVRYHRVQWGETLATVAKMYYGDAGLAAFIYQHNRGIITNPNNIYPGQLLHIPHTMVTDDDN
jgi:nucleoid-associated protein YgaU